ncbi:MAG: hypothetical protein JNL92_19745, partial [Opitutaceae bacterium]|nr:hypothetical protein [Opitutaceae bacterium]
MKLVPLLLAVSLLLNAAIGLVLVRSRTPESVPLPPPTTPRDATAPVPPVVDAETWSRLETRELPDLIARLRSEGFPPEVVRAIVLAQVNALFAARRQALDPAAGNRPYWKDQAPDSAQLSALRQLSREQMAMLRTLLGADAESGDPLRDLYQNRTFTFLAPEKAVDLRQLLRDYDERRSDLFAEGFNSVTDRAKVTALEKEQSDAIAALLTPEEFLEYKLRASNTASLLRDQLSAFEPTEEEFRALFKLREPFDEKYSSVFGPLMNEQLARERSVAEKAINDQFKATLTPERATAYERSTDYSYRRTSQLIARLELPAETTDR